MFKALYNHVNNIIEKYLQIYDHILIYLQWIKKEKLKLKQLLNHIHNDKKREKIKTNAIYTTSITTSTTSTTSIGTLRSNDATVSRNIRFNKQNNNSARASHFLHISLPFLHDCDVKMLNFAFCGERKQATTKLFLFLNFDMVPWNSTSERLQSYKVSG